MKHETYIKSIKPKEERSRSEFGQTKETPSTKSPGKGAAQVRMLLWMPGRNRSLKTQKGNIKEKLQKQEGEIRSRRGNRRKMNKQDE